MGKVYQEGVGGGVFYGTRDLLLAMCPKKRSCVLRSLLNKLCYENMQIEFDSMVKRSIMKSSGVNTPQRFSVIMKELVDSNIVCYVGRDSLAINPSMIWYGSVKSRTVAISEYNYLWGKVNAKKG